LTRVLAGFTQAPLEFAVGLFQSAQPRPSSRALVQAVQLQTLVEPLSHRLVRMSSLSHGFEI
jgi:hypothetical protein